MFKFLAITVLLQCAVAGPFDLPFASTCTAESIHICPDTVDSGEPTTVDGCLQLETKCKSATAQIYVHNFATTDTNGQALNALTLKCGDFGFWRPTQPITPHQFSIQSIRCIEEAVSTPIAN
ncbi:unnamed protein product, partial [Mesorhabditis spiculigera]